MKLDEFVESVTEGLKQHFGEGTEVICQKVVKTNDTVMNGLTIRAKGNVELVSPVFYLDSYYRKLNEEGMGLDEIIEEIEEDWRSLGSENKHCFDIDALTNWELAKTKVIPALVSRDRNKAMLEELVTREFLDLQIIYLLKLHSENNGPQGTVKIKEQMLEVYDITPDELHEQAMENMKREGISMQSMSSVLFGEGKHGQVSSMNPGELYVLSTKDQLYGASAVLDPTVISKACDGHDCYIIPSSVHEVLVLLTSDDMREDDVNKMIHAVNASEVAADEVLSDHVYYFDAKKGEVLASAS